MAVAPGTLPVSGVQTAPAQGGTAGRPGFSEDCLLGPRLLGGKPFQQSLPPSVEVAHRSRGPAALLQSSAEWTFCAQTDPCLGPALCEPGQVTPVF